MQFSPVGGRESVWSEDTDSSALISRITETKWDNVYVPVLPLTVLPLYTKIMSSSYSMMSSRTTSLSVTPSFQLFISWNKFFFAVAWWLRGRQRCDQGVSRHRGWGRIRRNNKQLYRHFQEYSSIRPSIFTPSFIIIIILCVLAIALNACCLLSSSCQKFRVCGI